MNMEKESFWLEQNFLSDIELYYSTTFSEDKNSLLILGEETRHISKVMRHKVGDEIFITDGTGSIYKAKISETKKEFVAANILSTLKYKNEYENIFVCIPLIKNFDRLEFALEKCVELGITNFIFYKAKRSAPKSAKLDRWQKIAVAAMKQSLRSFLPSLSYIENLSELSGKEIVIFDQNSKKSLRNGKISKSAAYFVFGPEGGFTENELKQFKSAATLRLTGNRLRTETAIVTFASQLALVQNF